MSVQRPDIATQAEDLRVFVWECEKDWRLQDLLDLRARLEQWAR